jgi:hypothetical protein
MNTIRRDWGLLCLTLGGAGLGQWGWLTRKWSFVVGLCCYIIALISWLKLTDAFTQRPRADRTVGLAWIGAGVFGALALFVGLRGPQQTPVALALAVVALGYVVWALGRGRSAAGIRRRAGRMLMARQINALLRRAIRTSYTGLQGRIKVHPIRAVMIGGSLLIIIGSGLAAHRGVRPTAHLISLSAWGLGLALFLAAFLPPHFLRHLVAWLSRLATEYRSETVLVLGLSALAAALRVPWLDRIPAVLTGDEGAMGLEAVKVLKGEQVNPFSTGWTSHPTLYFYNLALYLRFLGQNVPALRLASALAGTFTIPATYLLARSSFDKSIATLSALFLAGYHVHVHYSRLALNNVWAPFATVVTLLCLWAGLRTRQSWLFAVGGIAMGLGQYTYFGARLLPLVVCAWLLYLAFVTHESSAQNGAGSGKGTGQVLSLAGNGSRLVIFWLAFILTLLPLSWFFIEHWIAFTARMDQVGVFGSTGSDPTQEGYFFPLASGLFQSVTAFNYARDRSIFYGPPLPLLHWLSGIGFVFGVVETIRCRRAASCGLLMIWLASTVIVGGALMNHPPESPRLLFAAPATAILVALGLTRLGERMGQLFSQTFSRSAVRSGDGRLLALIAALIATGISVYYYFGVYTPSQQFGDRKTHIAHQMGVWARELNPDYRVFFFGAPYMTYSGFPSISFLAPRVSIQDVMDPIENPPAIKSDSAFVFVPRRLDELDIVSTAYPDGKRRVFTDDMGRLLFVTYDVDQEALFP